MPKKTIIILIAVLTANVLALDIYGLWELGTGDVTLNEDLHVYPGGVIQPYNAARILTVNGNIINEGIIQDHPIIPYLLTVNCTGNLTNSGSLTNYTLNMNGPAPQILATAFPFAPIEADFFNVLTPMPLIAATEVYFKNCSISFLSGGSLAFPAGLGLNLDNSYFSGGNITGKITDPAETYINMTNDAYINDSGCSNVNITGIFLISDSVSLSGNSVNNGEIKAWSNAHRTLTTYDSFINNGTITNNAPYETYLDSYGYFENNGTVINTTVNFYGNFSNKTSSFTPYYLYFKGSSAQSVSTAWNCPIGATYTSCTNTSGILAKSDLEFLNSLINFTDYPIDLTEGRTMYVDGGYMNRMAIVGAGTTGDTLSYLTLSHGCFNQNSMIKDLILNGTTDVSENNSFEGKVINSGTLQNKDWYWYTVTINGDFENTGTIKNNQSGYSINVDFKGANLHNAGIWGGYMLSFAGTAVQNLSNAYGAPFSPEYTSVSNTYGILAKSDLEFVNSNINFTDYDLDLSEGRTFFASGGYINRMNAFGARPEAKAVTYFNMTNGCYIQNSVLSDMNLNGTTTISEGMILDGKVINSGTIQNKEWYWYTLTINGDIDNIGTIQDNTEGYNLAVDFKGTNLYNAGTWTGEKLLFSGTSAQNLSCAFGHAIGTRYTECTNSNGVTAASDLFFNSSEISFSGYTLDLAAGYDADINGGFFNNVTVTGDPAETYLFLSNSARIYDSEIIDVMLNGWTNIDAGVVFGGNILNTGYLQNKPDSYADLLITGNLSNIGTVQDNPEGWWLNIQAKGNISNHGTWTNNKLDLNGDTHQHVTIGYGYSIACPEIYLTTNIVNGPYEWRYNKTPIQESDPDFSGETIQSLSWLVPMDLSYTGTFYCETGDGASKSVYINDGTFASPNITSISNNGTDVSITWDAIASAAYYRVFSSDDPYKDHNDSSWFCEDENVTTNSWTAPVPVGNKKFYFVTAVY